MMKRQGRMRLWGLVMVSTLALACGDEESNGGNDSADVGTDIAGGDVGTDTGQTGDAALGCGAAAVCINSDQCGDQEFCNLELGCCAPLQVDTICRAQDQACEGDTWSNDNFQCLGARCLARCDAEAETETCESGSVCFFLTNPPEGVPNGVCLSGDCNDACVSAGACPAADMYTCDCTDAFSPFSCFATNGLGTCLPNSNNASYCQGGNVPLNGACTTGGQNPQLCQGGLVCFLGECVEPCDANEIGACGEEAECAPLFGQAGQNRPGVCLAGCDAFSEGQCPEGTRCGPITVSSGIDRFACLDQARSGGDVVPTVEPGGSCDADSTDGVDNQCAEGHVCSALPNPLTCSDDDDCFTATTGLRCIQDRCQQPITCTNSSECPGEVDCDEHRDADNEVVDDFCQTDGALNQGICVQLCDSTETVMEGDLVDCPGAIVLPSVPVVPDADADDAYVAVAESSGHVELSDIAPTLDLVSDQSASPLSTVDLDLEMSAAYSLAIFFDANAVDLEPQYDTLLIEDWDDASMITAGQNGLRVVNLSVDDVEIHGASTVVTDLARGESTAIETWRLVADDVSFDSWVHPDLAQVWQFLDLEFTTDTSEVIGYGSVTLDGGMVTGQLESAWLANSDPGMVPEGGARVRIFNALEAHAAVTFSGVTINHGEASDFLSIEADSDLQNGDDVLWTYEMTEGDVITAVIYQTGNSIDAVVLPFPTDEEIAALDLTNAHAVRATHVAEQTCDAPCVVQPHTYLVAEPYLAAVTTRTVGALEDVDLQDFWDALLVVPSELAGLLEGDEPWLALEGPDAMSDEVWHLNLLDSPDDGLAAIWSGFVPPSWDENDRRTYLQLQHLGLGLADGVRLERPGGELPEEICTPSAVAGLGLCAYGCNIFDGTDYLDEEGNPNDRWVGNGCPGNDDLNSEYVYSCRPFVTNDDQTIPFELAGIPDLAGYCSPRRRDTARQLFGASCLREGVQLLSDQICNPESICYPSQVNQDNTVVRAECRKSCLPFSGPDRPSDCQVDADVCVNFFDNQTLGICLEPVVDVALGELCPAETTGSAICGADDARCIGTSAGMGSDCTQLCKGVPESDDPDGDLDSQCPEGYFCDTSLVFTGLEVWLHPCAPTN